MGQLREVLENILTTKRTNGMMEEKFKKVRGDAKDG